MNTHAGSVFDNHVTLTLLDLFISGSMHAERLTELVGHSTKFGVDSSSRFSFSARTHRQTHTHTVAQSHRRN